MTALQSGTYMEKQFLRYFGRETMPDPKDDPRAPQELGTGEQITTMLDTGFQKVATSIFGAASTGVGYENSLLNRLGLPHISGAPIAQYFDELRQGSVQAEHEQQRQITIGGKPYTPAWFSRQMIEGVPQLTYLIASGVFTGPAGVFSAGTIMSGGEIASETYDRLKAEGNSNDEARSAAFEAMAAYGPIAGALQTIPVERILGATGNFTLKRVATSSVVMGAASAASGAARDITTAATGGEVPGLGEFLSRRAQEAASGGLMGAVATGVSGATGRFAKFGTDPEASRALGEAKNREAVRQFEQTQKEIGNAQAVSGDQTQGPRQQIESGGNLRGQGQEQGGPVATGEVAARPLTADNPPATPQLDIAGPTAQPKAAPSEPNQAGKQAKEPWQMTRAAFVEHIRNTAIGKLDTAEQLHYVRTRQAVEAGKPVPPEVLADYPDLSPPSPSIQSEVVASAGSPEPPPDAAMGAASAKELAPPAETSIKNESMAQQRERLGMPAVDEPTPQTFEEWNKAAEQRISDNPELPRQLVADLSEKPRAPTPIETAVLQRYERQLTTDINKAGFDWVQAIDSGNTTRIADTQARVDALWNELEQAGDVFKKVGAESGRSLAARNMGLLEDMTLAQMVSAKQSAEGRVQLTADERAEITQLHTQVSVLKDELNTARKAATEGSKRAAGDKPPKEAADPHVRAIEKRIAVLSNSFRDDLLNTRLRNRYSRDIQNFRNSISTGQPVPRPEPRVTRELPPDVFRLKKQRDLLKQAAEAKQKTAQRSFVRRLWGATGIMRLLQTTGEFSFMGRQLGKGLFSGIGGTVHGKPAALAAWGRALGLAMRAAVSDAYARAHDEMIFNHPNLARWDQAKLRIVHEGEHISGTEEVRISSWVDRLPIVKQINRAARIAFNDLRTSTFDAMTLPDKTGSLEHDKAVAHAVNVLTGYGSLGRAEAAAPYLSAALYSPRYLMATIQFAIGEPLWRGDAVSRRAVAMQYADIAVGLGAIYGLGMLAGGETEWDPRSTDFGKIRFGNVRVDPMLGLSQIVVFTTREITGETKTGAGDIQPVREILHPLDLFRGEPLAKKVPFGGPTGFDVLMRFARSKASPNIGLAIDLMAGKTFAGKTLTTQNVAGRFLPLTSQDIYDAMVDRGVPSGSAIGFAAFFGAGLQTYQQKQQQSRPPMAMIR